MCSTENSYLHDRSRNLLWKLVRIRNWPVMVGDGDGDGDGDG